MEVNIKTSLQKSFVIKAKNLSSPLKFKEMSISLSCKRKICWKIIPKKRVLCFGFEWTVGII